MTEDDATDLVQQLKDEQAKKPWPLAETKTFTVQDGDTADVVLGLRDVTADNAILMRIAFRERPLDSLEVGEGTKARDSGNGFYFIVRTA